MGYFFGCGGTTEPRRSYGPVVPCEDSGGGPEGDRFGLWGECLTQTLEWFQCKGCGRRHRWQADIAGSQVQCSCGSSVFCPELDVFGDSDSSDTLADPSASIIYAPAGEASTHFPGEVMALEGEASQALQLRRMKAGGLFGMGPFGEVVFWTVGAAVGFTVLVHALIVQWPVYIALAVVWAPISFAKCWKKIKRWQGNRSFMRALEEQFGDE